MLVSIYITLVILAFVLFTIAMVLGRNMNRLGTAEAVGTTKKGLLIFFLLLSMVLFIIVSLGSMNIETEYCGHCCIDYVNQSEQQQQWPEPPLFEEQQQVYNTTYAMQMHCITTQHKSEALTGIFGFMVIFCILFFFYYALAKE